MFGDSTHLLPVAFGTLFTSDRPTVLELLRERQVRESYAPSSDPGLDTAIAVVSDWLFRAQDTQEHPDGSVSEHFSFLRGWAPPTVRSTALGTRAFLLLAGSSSEAVLIRRAERGLAWVSKHAPNGPSVDASEQTHAAYLRALIASTHQFGEIYLRPTLRHAGEIVSQHGRGRLLAVPPEGDIQFELVSALLETARISKDPRYSDAALAHVGSALSWQNRWGAFVEPVSVHRPVCARRMSVALRALLDAYIFSWDGRYLDSALRLLMPMLRQLRTDGFLPGSFDSRFESAAEWSCLSGALELAKCSLTLFELTGERHFLESARRITSYVRRTLGASFHPDIRGAVRGSYPAWGKYERYRLPVESAVTFLATQLHEQRILARQTRSSELRFDDGPQR